MTNFTFQDFEHILADEVGLQDVALSPKKRPATTRVKREKEQSENRQLRFKQDYLTFLEGLHTERKNKEGPRPPTRPHQIERSASFAQKPRRFEPVAPYAARQEQLKEELNAFSDLEREERRRRAVEMSKMKAAQSKSEVLGATQRSLNAGKTLHMADLQLVEDAGEGQTEFEIFQQTLQEACPMNIRWFTQTPIGESQAQRRMLWQTAREARRVQQKDFASFDMSEVQANEPCSVGMFRNVRATQAQADDYYKASRIITQTKLL